jgi:hypothetical protein
MLWQVTLDFLRRHPSAADPNGVDRGRIDDLLVELYVLGERPTVADVRAYFDATGLAESRRAARMVTVWTERLARPTRRHRAAQGWLYPFAVPEQLASEHGLEPVAPRLARALAAAAADHLAHAEVEPAGDAARNADRLFTITSNAVRLYALSRDRVEDDRRPSSFPSIVVVYKTWLDSLAERETRSGRARAEAKLAEQLRIRGELEARARAEKRLDP